MKSTAAVPIVVVIPTPRLKPPSMSASRIRARMPAPDAVRKRLCSRSSCENAFTTRNAASTSWTTERAELSSSFVSFHPPRRVRRDANVRPKRTGATASATSASCRSMLAVIAIMPASVRPAVRNGVIP